MPGAGAGTGKEGAGVISGGGAADGAGDLCLVMVLYKMLRQQLAMLTPGMRQWSHALLAAAVLHGLLPERPPLLCRGGGDC